MLTITQQLFFLFLVSITVNCLLLKYNSLLLNKKMKISIVGCLIIHCLLNVQSINVMDYSLLVGVDSQRQVLVCGIIDYLRQYTWDKHLETWMKSSLVVPKNVLPTVISPKEYKKRFRKFMSTHFLSVPDHWCSKKSTDPCKLCCSSEDDSSWQNPSNKGC